MDYKPTAPPHEFRNAESALRVDSVLTDPSASASIPCKPNRSELCQGTSWNPLGGPGGRVVHATDAAPSVPPGPFEPKN